jgi:hypothetical protein
MRPIALLVLVVVAAPAAAQEEDDDGYVTPAREVAPVAAPKVIDDVGGASGYVMNQGIYVQGALGGFFRVGGYDVTQGGPCPEIACNPVATSDMQASVSLALGVDVNEWLAAQVQSGVGYVAGAAAYENRSADVPRDYALSRAELALVARMDIASRIAATFTAGAGVGAVTPTPGVDQPPIGATMSAGAGVRLLSLLPSMSVGADVMWHGAMFPSKVPGTVAPRNSGVDGEPLFVHAFSFAPVIKYVF